MAFQNIEKTVPALIPGERYAVRVRAISNLGVVSDWSEAYEVNITDAPSINEWLEAELTLHVADPDPHNQYAFADGTRGNFEVAGAVGLHESDPDPHIQYALADGTRGTFEAAGAVVTHEAAGDPHNQYALADGSRGSFLQTAKVYGESFAVASVAAGETRTLSITFGVGQFAAAPYLSVSPFCASATADVTFHVTEVTTTGATVILRNNDAAAADIGAYVMAIEA